jgi:hypothetical protein
MGLEWEETLTNLLNEHARHQKFGKGTIVEQSATIIAIKFDDEHGIKKFVYPTAFEHFLELCGQDAHEKVVIDIQRENERIAEEQAQKAKENKKIRDEERRQAQEQKRPPAKKRAAPKSKDIATDSTAEKPKAKKAAPKKPAAKKSE